MLIIPARSVTHRKRSLEGGDPGPRKRPPVARALELGLLRPKEHQQSRRQVHLRVAQGAEKLVIAVLKILRM